MRAPSFLPCPAFPPLRRQGSGCGGGRHTRRKLTGFQGSAVNGPLWLPAVPLLPLPICSSAPRGCHSCCPGPPFFCLLSWIPQGGPYPVLVHPQGTAALRNELLGLQGSSSAKHIPPRTYASRQAHSSPKRDQTCGVTPLKSALGWALQAAYRGGGKISHGV